jgi:hypothetical protein
MEPLVTERIRERAYSIWDRAGRPHGRDREHWFAAEAEIAKAERELIREAAGGGAGAGRAEQPAAGAKAPNKRRKARSKKSGASGGRKKS